MRNQVGIHGVPRSGTSWLGQIFDSSPAVAYRFQPLFSHAFKNRIGEASSPAEILRFLSDLEATDDPFILRRQGLSSDGAFEFSKQTPTHMVMKHVRYHNLLRTLLHALPRFRMIGLVRHPCATLNSWLRAPKEFDSAWDVRQEWREAPLKNRGLAEEFNGFEKWMEATRLFLALEKEFPGRVKIIRYAALLAEPLKTVSDVFAFCSLDVGDQTIEFLRRSTERHSDDRYSVFKVRSADDAWRDELDEEIATELLRDVRGSDLERFTLQE